MCDFWLLLILDHLHHHHHLLSKFCFGFIVVNGYLTISVLNVTMCLLNVTKFLNCRISMLGSGKSTVLLPRTLPLDSVSVCVCVWVCSGGRGVECISYL